MTADSRPREESAQSKLYFINNVKDRKLLHVSGFFRRLRLRSRNTCTVSALEDHRKSPFNTIDTLHPEYKYTRSLLGCFSKFKSLKFLHNNLNSVNKYFYCSATSTEIGSCQTLIWPQTILPYPILTCYTSHLEALNKVNNYVLTAILGFFLISVCFLIDGNFFLSRY